VLNGGDGAWKQPIQTILFLLYGEVFDGVVMLDGFNEHYIVESIRLEMPSPNFTTINPVVTGSYQSIAATWAANEIIRYARENPILSHSFLAYAVVDAGRSYLEAKATRSAGMTTLDSIFQLPQDWTAQQKFAFNMEQYKKYIRSTEVLAKARDVRTAYFIQPVPAIGKRLTEDEKRVVQTLDYGPLYLRMAESLLGLSKEGIAIFSLLDVFAGETSTLYADWIHMKFDSTHDSPGYRIMASAMAQRIGDAWGLERTCQMPFPTSARSSPNSP
jgi:hypothetical protein